VTQRERGRGGEKRIWAIEQNEARETYLNHYFGMDVANHMIKNTANKYITWKYWHVPYLHLQSMGIVAAYDMYKECCDGLLDATWKVDVKDRMSYSESCMKLSKQMLEYDPKNNVYNGDDKQRSFTQNHKVRMSIDKGMESCERVEALYPEDGLTLANFKLARKFPRLQCNFASDFGKHLANIGSPCEVCGRNCLTKCLLCGKLMCTTDKRKWNGARCALLFHSEEFFGLARSDYQTVHGKEVSAWKPPSQQTIERNNRRIKSFQNAINAEESLGESNE